jgi:fucose 4-O-acetylase-like acetyltransferase
VNNFKFINTAKAILILLVVTWHFHYTSNPLPFKNIIYTFHVPAFLLITGFLIQPKIGKYNFLYLFKVIVLPLLRGYGLFSAISIAIFLVVTFTNDSISIANVLKEALYTTVYGVGAGENSFSHRNLPLWYFTFLISSLLAAFLLRKFKFTYQLITLLPLQVIISQEVAFKAPWNIDIVAIGALYITTGVAARNYLALRPSLVPLSFRAATVLALSSAVMLSVIAANTGNINYNGGQFRTSIITTYLSAIFGTASILFLSMLIPERKLLDEIGSNTLVIFCLHFPILLIISKAANMAGYGIGIIEAIAISILICIALSKLSLLLDRPLKQILGK